MTRSRGHEVTELLRSWRQGDVAALDRLVPLVDPELRRAATLMRQILVDHARRKRGAKRDGPATVMSLDNVSPVSETSIVDVLALDQALDALSSRDARRRRVVESVAASAIVGAAVSATAFGI